MREAGSARAAARRSRAPWAMAATVAFGLALIAGVALNRLSLGVLVGVLLAGAIGITWLRRRLGRAPTRGRSRRSRGAR
ncbi:hypothetical protein [Ruicaihuangia caeni]|uniref:Uncharacterized protein n=1 Tax=Ruicaihuangia caeni TaxID=3042517 RepID=A0AAW6T6T6_9MICO|nr:hypothetical protein [Klugiella sp. YN-L-19]MDI2097533.1 hypothetical protein [Klugiella sp. YN-L-19]